jgi:hypothetical protein
MSKQQVCLERLVGNHSVGQPADGTLFSHTQHLPPRFQQLASHTIGGALVHMQHQPLQPALQGLVLPAPWLVTLQAAAAQPWEVSANGGWVRQNLPGTPVYYVVQPTGRLSEPLQQVVPAALTSQEATWHGCCVVDVSVALHPVAVQQRQKQQQQQHHGQPQQHGQQQQQPNQPPRPKYYLVGAWDSIRVDPSVWGFGFYMGVLQFTVRGATQRLLQWQCTGKPGWVPGVGLIPRLWRDPSGVLQPQTGLQTIEAGQKRRWEQMAAGASSSRGSTAGIFSDEAQQHAYDTAWMRPSPVRQHPMQRVAAAAAVVTRQRQQQLTALVVGAPTHDDLVDPLTGLQHPPQLDAGWVAAYRRLQLPRLPKALRVFGWRLLHNALWVGARKMHFRPRNECVCQHEHCMSLSPVPLQTLTHVLLECPVAVDVWGWFLTLWRRIDPTTTVAASSQLLLLDALSVAVVSLPLQPLWTHLRLLLLESSWVGRGDPAKDMTALSADAIKHRFVAIVKQQVLNDWRRTKHDIRWHAGVPASWFRGLSPELEIADFKALWCAGGVIAMVGTLTGAAAHAFCLRVS